MLACCRNFIADYRLPALLLKHALNAVQAFGALRVLSEQMHMQQCSSLAVTDGIRVDVTSAYIGVSMLQCANASLNDIPCIFVLSCKPD